MGASDSETQKAQLDEYLKEVGKYSDINKKAYKSLVENLDALNIGLFDDLIGLLPKETQNLGEIEKVHGDYKKLFNDGKKNIHDGGVLDKLFEQYKAVIKKVEKAPEKADPKEIENAFQKMNKTYLSLVNGILMVYSPGILSVYHQIAGDDKKYAKKGKKIEKLLKILKDDYKAEELIKRVQREHEKQKKAAT